MQIIFDKKAQQINVLDERFYKVFDKDVYYPSSTTILEAYYKGYGFTDWLKQVGYNADIIIEKAGQIGTNVHNAIEMINKGFELSWFSDDNCTQERYSLHEWQMICKYMDFIRIYNPEILACEWKFCSEKFMFGGTIDLICKINGEIWLIDYKTSEYIHKTHYLQIASYCLGWNELNNNYKIDRFGILHLKAQTRTEGKNGKIHGEGWQLKEEGRTYDELFKLFQHTQAIWLEEHPNYKPKNIVYPVKLKL